MSESPWLKMIKMNRNIPASIEGYLSGSANSRVVDCIDDIRLWDSLNDNFLMKEGSMEDPWIVLMTIQQMITDKKIANEENSAYFPGFAC